MSNHRVIVVSIPKSGTYLVAEVLKALGYRWTGMHLAESAYTDYSGSAARRRAARPGPLRPQRAAEHRASSGFRPVTSLSAIFPLKTKSSRQPARSNGCS